MTLISIGIACLLIGSSMAYLIFEAKGTTQTISAGTLQLSYTNESEAVSLNNAVPQSNEQGLNNDTYSITLTNTSTIKSYYELSLNNNCTVGNSYTVNGTSVTANVCIPNNYIKVAVKTSNDEDYTIKNGGNVILKGYLEAKENILFEMIIWLTEETPNDYQGQTEEGTLRNVIYNGNFKIYTRQILEDDNLDLSGANNPVLASNMIPVYYDVTEEVWKKADGKNENKNYRWYSYESDGEYKGMWANAVTVTETNRKAYLNAAPGTIIPMDDITTMWVWIPRFKVNTTDFTLVRGEDVGYCRNWVSQTDYTKEECEKLELDDDHFSWVTIYKPGAIDISFVKTSEPAMDAFTFGTKELNGFWYGKFEVSHSTLASSTTDNNLECTSYSCSNANGIIIKPNVQSLRYNDVFSFFNASRNMEQNGNSFGFVSSEVDTHMTKNNEWGAVAYLTQSIYGRCTDNTTCSEVYRNNSSEYYTGRSGNIPNASSTNIGTYEYNEAELMVVEGTGKTITPTITNDTTYPWTNKNGVYSSGNSKQYNTTSTLTYTFTLTDKGVVSFDYSVSSLDNYDKMKYTINKDSIVVVIGTEISGTSMGMMESSLQYESKFHVLEAGTYTLVFTYSKDEFGIAGLDKGYVKNVKVLNGAQTNRGVQLGVQASTTGTIYGIYDMSGGTGEYVMGTYNMRISGIGKYYNVYNTTSYMGHALAETANWYGAYYEFKHLEDWRYLLRAGNIFDCQNYVNHSFEPISTHFVITNE